MILTLTQYTHSNTHAASIPVIGFNAVLMSEHFGAFLAFIVLHAAMLVSYIQSTLPTRARRIVMASLLTGTGAVLAAGLAAVAGYVLRSPTYGWTGGSVSCFVCCLLCVFVFECVSSRAGGCGWLCAALSYLWLDRCVCVVVCVCVHCVNDT